MVDSENIGKVVRAPGHFFFLFSFLLIAGNECLCFEFQVNENVWKMDPIWLHDYMRKGRQSLCTELGIRPKQNPESREVKLGEKFQLKSKCQQVG